MPQQLHGRRGENRTVRITDEEEAAIRQRMGEAGGPLEFGPWLVWRALDGKPPRRLQLGLPGLGAGFRHVGALPELPAVGERLILDLCGGSGSWSAPYRAKGYPVQIITLPEHDVRTYVPPPDVWGVLAAPPCEKFSLAANGHPELERDFVAGMEAVNACLRIILQARPRWWALENPVGLLSKFLGTPRDTWQPCDFGDPWTKQTAIWGEYELPARGPFVAPQWGGGPRCTEHGDPEKRKTPTCSRAACRAKTPPGFARAFCEANL